MINWTFVKWLLGILLGGGLACSIVIVNRGCNDNSIQNPPVNTGSSPSPPPPQEGGPDLFSPNPAPDAPPPEWKQTDFKGKDKNGKEFGIRVGVLWDPYRWVLGSSSEIGIDDTESLPIEQIIQRSPKGENRPIIVVGTASHENAADNPDKEVARAGARADRLDALCQSYYPDADISSVNLGFYRGGSTSSSSSATERRVILLVIRCSDEGVDLDSGVRNALIEASKDDDFSFDVHDYSNFDEPKFQVRERRSIGKTAIPECSTLAHNGLSMK
jgi:hypothetical protein